MYNVLWLLLFSVFHILFYLLLRSSHLWFEGVGGGVVVPEEVGLTGFAIVL
jgi:hypothetical protein